MIIKLKNFKEGLAGTPIFPQASAMVNCYIKEDGSLHRRPGLANAANFKTSASTSVEITKNIFWLPYLSKWVGATTNGRGYEITEGAATGAVLKFLDIAINRLSMAEYIPSPTRNYFFGGSELFLDFSINDTVIYRDNSAYRLQYVFPKGSDLNAAGSLSAVSESALITAWYPVTTMVYAGSAMVPVLVAGCLIGHDHILALKEDGSVWAYSDGWLRRIAENLGKPMPNTLVSTPYGLVWASESGDVYIYAGGQLKKLTGNFSWPDVLIANYDNAAVTDIIDHLSDDWATAGTASASSDDGLGHVAANVIDGSSSTYWARAPGDVNPYVKVDLGSNKTILQIVFKTAAGSVSTLVIEGSTDDITYTSMGTPSSTQSDGAVQPTWKYYYINNTTPYRYIKFSGAAMTNALCTLEVHDLTTYHATANNRKHTAAYNSAADEYWVSYLNTSAAWKTYIYNFKHGYWREFSSGKWDQGSYGIKAGDFYLTLKQFTPAGGSLNYEGLWKYGNANTADPDATFNVQYCTGWVELSGDRSLEYIIRKIYIDGQGWDTCNVYSDYNGTAVTSVIDLTGLVNPAVVPKTPTTNNAVLAKRYKVELLGTVKTTEGSKEIYCKGIEVWLEESRDFTGGKK